MFETADEAAGSAVAMLEAADQALISGFVVNKFCGDEPGALPSA